MLYLNGRLQYLPKICIEKPGKRYSCSRCGEEIISNDALCDIECGSCGASAVDNPILAFGCDRADRPTGRVKYKEYRKLDFYQTAASIELCNFLDSDVEECLLWTVPGSLNCGIFSESIRRVLDKGGRVGIAVPEEEDRGMFLDVLKDTFPGLSCLDMQHKGSGIQDILVCDYTHMADYYRAFDLLIIYKNANIIKRHGNGWYKHIKRAAIGNGKVVYFTSSPGYETFADAKGGSIALVAVPLKSHGRPSPEPRIVTYRGLSPDNLFIPEAVLGIIKWSLEKGIRVRIVVPYNGHINLLKDVLINSGIEGYNFNELNSKILLSTCELMHKYKGEAENIIVFFADDDIFNERILLETAGISEKCPPNGAGEVVFVGARESLNMYNAKLMIRELNKKAWEMGYLK